MTILDRLYVGLLTVFLVLVMATTLAGASKGSSAEIVINDAIDGCLRVEFVRARGLDPNQVVPTSASHCRSLARWLPRR